MRSPESQRRFRRNRAHLRQRFRSGRRNIEDVHWAWVSEISEHTINQLKAGHLVKLSPARSESFSSINSVNTRKKFKLAVENIKRGILGFATGSGKNIKVITIMDSPPDLSPNAPPTGYDDTANYFANLQAPPAPPSSTSTGQASTEGSVDSSGFEKVDHDVLEEYGQQFVNQMQQALFGTLPEEADTAVSPQYTSSLAFYGSFPSFCFICHHSFSLSK
ncbi:unnamed protein product [Haemonchus placei]|uniref:MADS-box domain-containing protein n=1 Tax=Haemonchus placei TaxID=6290 RepID=A0A0N4W7A6_HAEPC|nr:unnamed protein product [Haemonchus placei]